MGRDCYVSDICLQIHAISQSQKAMFRPDFLCFRPRNIDFWRHRNPDLRTRMYLLEIGNIEWSEIPLFYRAHLEISRIRGLHLSSSSLLPVPSPHHAVALIALLPLHGDTPRCCDASKHAMHPHAAATTQPHRMCAGVCLPEPIRRSSAAARRWICVKTLAQSPHSPPSVPRLTNS